MVFAPTAFDRHCASCHTKNGFLTGETEPMPADDVLLPDALSASLSSGPPFAMRPDEPRWPSTLCIAIPGSH